MDFAETDAEATFRRCARDWLAANGSAAPEVELMPGSADAEAWRAWSRRLYDAGFAGLSWPQSYGGRGLGPEFQAIWSEEISRAGLADHMGLIGLCMAGPTLIDWGTPTQKERFLDPTLKSDIVWCQGFSEPGSGSDLASIRTRAVRDGSDWVVTGQKVWSSWAHMADWCILLTRSEADESNHRALTYLLLDMNAPGVTVRPLRQMTGDPEFNEIYLDDVRVAAEMTVGAPGQGWQVAMTTLKHERSSLGLGLASRLSAAVHEVGALMRRENSDGRRPADDPDLVARLADAWVQSQALRMLNLRVVSALRATGELPPFANITKLAWSESNQRLMKLAQDALGSEAVVSDVESAQRWNFQQLRSRGNSIEAGTSEVLRSVIAERVLGLPRSR